MNQYYGIFVRTYQRFADVFFRLSGAINIENKITRSKQNDFLSFFTTIPHKFMDIIYLFGRAIKYTCIQTCG